MYCYTILVRGPLALVCGAVTVEQPYSCESKSKSQSPSPYAASGRFWHTAFLTVNWTLARTSGAALIQRPTSHTHARAHVTMLLCFRGLSASPIASCTRTCCSRWDTFLGDLGSPPALWPHRVRMPIPGPTFTHKRLRGALNSEHPSPFCA